VVSAEIIGSAASAGPDAKPAAARNDRRGQGLIAYQAGASR
jgi:hypothetical protein